MNYAARGVRTSFLIHAAFIVLLVALTHSVTHENTAIVIDLGIGNASVGKAPSPSFSKERVVGTRGERKPAPSLQESSAVPAPSLSDDARTPPVQESASQPGGEGASSEELRNRYLSEYFAYIRDSIMKNLSFPRIARKMGWSGKAVVSFVVCTDGHVENIKIMESTGFGILDKNVVDTIKKLSPFPKAPVNAEVTVPIVYRLL